VICAKPCAGSVTTRRRGLRVLGFSKNDEIFCTKLGNSPSFATVACDHRKSTVSTVTAATTTSQSHADEAAVVEAHELLTAVSKRGDCNTSWHRFTACE